MRFPTRHTPSREDQGFTLVQTLIVIFIIAILVSLLIPNVLDYNKRIKGIACANNMRNIQAAKDAWIKDYPETTTIPAESNLASYLKGSIPHCPAGGTYLYLLDCTQPVACSLDGIANFEPLDSTPLTANGHHDFALPK